MNMWVSFVAVFLATLVADVCWTLYFIQVEQRAAIKAAFWSSMIIVAGCFTTIMYVKTPVLGIAAVLGSFVGTYLTIKFQPKRTDT